VSPARQDLDREFAEETNRLIAERLPLLTLAFALVFGAAWIFEHRVHPNREVAYLVCYIGELATLGGAALLARQARWRSYSQTIAVAATIVLSAWIGLYHVHVGGEGEVLALALAYLVTGAMVLLPWTWEAQLLVAVSAVVIDATATALGVRSTTTLPINLLGLAAVCALSVAGSAFLSRHRRTQLSQAAELRAANAALAEANQSKNQFLASVSHELRTPLNIIVGYTDLLLEGHFGALPAEATDVLDRVARNGRSLVYLISDLLDFSRMEAGRLLVRLAPVELAPVFAEMVHFVESRIGSSPGVHFSMTHPGSLRVIADRERLEQILVNLLSNAAKFTPTGEIHLLTQPPCDNTVAIEVRDTGVGIDHADLAQIFEPFGQGEVGKRLGGVGIGLSLSSRLAHAMGGALTVSSEVGRGSTFVLRLPAAT